MSSSKTPANTPHTPDNQAPPQKQQPQAQNEAQQTPWSQVVSSRNRPLSSTPTSSLPQRNNLAGLSGNAPEFHPDVALPPAIAKQAPQPEKASPSAALQSAATPVTSSPSQPPSNVVASVPIEGVSENSNNNKTASSSTPIDQRQKTVQSANNDLKAGKQGGNDKNDDDSDDESDHQSEQLTFFDETYAQAHETGVGGRSLQIKANRFRVDIAAIKSLFVYSIKFSKIRGRHVKNPNVKKILIQHALSDQAWAHAMTQDEIFTDWSDLIITKRKLEDLSHPKQVPTSADGQVEIQFNLPNSGSATSDSITMTMCPNEPLDMEQFRRYMGGQQPADFNFSPYSQACNILVKHFAAKNTKIARAGKNRFFAAETAHHGARFQSGLLGRAGFFTSIRPATIGLQLQLNTSAAAFYPNEKVIDFLGKRFKRNQDSPGFKPQGANTKLLPDIKAALQHLHVQYLYTPPNGNQPGSGPCQRPPAQSRLKCISGFGKAANVHEFDVDSNTSRTVEHHFNQKVFQGRYKLLFPHLPVVNTGGKAKKTQVWIPMELLYIAPNRPLASTVPSSDMKAMANISRRLPQENVFVIENEGLALIEASELDKRDILRIDKKMLEIRGRMLTVPTLRYLRNATVDNRFGKWSVEGMKFQTGEGLGRLFVIQLGDLQNQRLEPAPFQKMIDTLAGHGVKTGVMSLGRVKDPKDHSVLSAEYDNWRQKDPENLGKVILVVLEKADIDNYASVKRWADTVQGSALKFNAKLGGQNHILSDAVYSKLHGGPNAATMVVGADVTHPGPSSIPHCPSIAAVVASTDKQCVKFPGSMRLQRSRSERILDLTAMMVERLRLWYRTNRETLPANILFYRDGVGENQWAMVKRHELSDIREASRLIAEETGTPGYNPSITLVVCTKRHANRFYPTTEKGQYGRDFLDRKKKNFKPGLVVDDKAIRLPRLFDFWLQAQQPLQGTGRPCHYFVLENEMNINQTWLQEMTFALSWVYATSLTPISVVAPAYYADKLCERGRCYIRGLLVGRHNDRPSEETLKNWIDGFGKTTTEQKNDQVAAEIAKGHFNLWHQDNKSNPCKDDLENSMFYI